MALWQAFKLNSTGRMKLKRQWLVNDGALRQFSTPCPTNSGSLRQMSFQLSCPSTRDLTAARMSVSEALTCFMLSLSLSVIEPFLTVSKSTVIPKGVPSSSFLEYLLPILAEESSNRFEMPISRRLLASLRTIGRNDWCDESGTSSNFVGAIAGGRERT